MAGYGLSKSRITAWRQCPKRLWLQIHRRELLEISDQAEHAFQIGYEVGEVAQRLCPDGILIGDDNNLTAAIEATRAAIAAHPDRPIFEATFQHDGLLVRVDVLLPTPDGYRLTEVKSSTEVKPYHVDDCAVQAWVLLKNGIPLASVELAHVDTSFVYQGDGNYHGLLKSVRLDEEISQLLGVVPGWVEQARKDLSGDEPAIAMGTQCDDPYECPFKAYCTRNMPLPEAPKYPLDILYRMGAKTKEELHSRGYQDARNVPLRYLNETQRWIQRVSKSGKPSLDVGTAQKVMSALPYPRYYLDFETVTLAVPRWAETRPYLTQVPFQWSCHIEYAPGRLRHEMFLDVTGNDPRRPFAEFLIQVLNGKGPVIVYNQSFEKSRITELANLFPDLAHALSRINERVVDLLPITRRNYYHPDMMGSWSIKAVLPTVAPDLGYANLVVGNGGDAQAAYREIIHPETSGEHAQTLTEGLREYCTLDTLAMARLAWLLEGSIHFREYDTGTSYMIYGREIRVPDELIVRRNVRAMVVVSGDTISEEDVRKVERVAQSITQQSRTEIELAHRRLFFELDDGEQTACPVGCRSKNLECTWELTMMKRADLTKPEGVRNAS